MKINDLIEKLEFFQRYKWNIDLKFIDEFNIFQESEEKNKIISKIVKNYSNIVYIEKIKQIKNFKKSEMKNWLFILKYDPFEFNRHNIFNTKQLLIDLHFNNISLLMIPTHEFEVKYLDFWLRNLWKIYLDNNNNISIIYLKN